MRNREIEKGDRICGPILYLEKPSRAMVTIGNMIFQLLSKEHVVDWGKVIQDAVGKLFSGVGKQKGSPISPFLYHMYKHEGLLTLGEENTWNIQ